jgi:hypothetical protein
MALAPVKQPVNWVESEWQARACRTPWGRMRSGSTPASTTVPYGVNVVIQIAADDLYYKTVNGQPVTDLEIGFGERNPRSGLACGATARRSPSRRIRRRR